MRLAVGKKILKDKGALKLGVSDLLYTNQPGGNIKGLANSTARWYSLLDSRVVTLAFSYRFNKGQSLKARQIDGSESERQRVR
jgi:iron complex outermembrane recepter protein